jgi:hypothetical protein
MVTKIKEYETIFNDPNAEIFEYKKPIVTQPILMDVQKWQTPGLYLAHRIASNPLVRFIGEKMQVDYLQTIIVVDDDPEELVDKIFSVEQKMYKKFKNLRFDVRLRVISKEEDIEVIQKSTIHLYDRKKFKLITSDEQYK